MDQQQQHHVEKSNNSEMDIMNSDVLHAPSTDATCEEEWDDMAILKAFDEAVFDTKQQIKNSKKAAKQRKKEAASEEFGMGNTNIPFTVADEFQIPNNDGIEAMKQFLQNEASESRDDAATAATTVISNKNNAAVPHTSAADLKVQELEAKIRKLELLNSRVAAAPAAPNTTPNSGGGAPCMPPMMVPGTNDLSQLLLSWYYSGYYTGRYMAQLENANNNNNTGPPPPTPPF